MIKSQCCYLARVLILPRDHDLVVWAIVRDVQLYLIGPLMSDVSHKVRFATAVLILMMALTIGVGGAV